MNPKNDVIKKYQREDELAEEPDEDTLKNELEKLKKEAPQTFPPEKEN